MSNNRNINTILLVLIFIVLSVGVFVLIDNKKIKNTDSVGQMNQEIFEVTNPEIKNSAMVENKKVVTENSILSDLYIFDRSLGNPSDGSSDSHAIVATKPLSTSSDPVCGDGNNYVPACSIFIEDYLGKIIKINEWPNESVRKKYPNIFTSTYSDFDKITYRAQNFYEKGSISFASKGTVVFRSHKMSDCGGYTIQNWVLNYKTGDYKLLGEEKGKADDCD